MTQRQNYNRTLLLQRLADGQFHSGEALGEEMGISRAAVSKHIKMLTELGLDIFSVTGKGYRLAKPLSLLSHNQISRALSKNYDAQIEVLNIIDSTNDYLKHLHRPLTNGHVCFAEAQTAGRGRHGRQWVSPYGASIYLSMYWSFPGGYQAINGLSLVVGIALTTALQRLNVPNAALKWPNDVYLDGKKLAGVLVEVEGQLGAACDCTIGVGLNIDLPVNKVEIDQAWTDLSKASGNNFDRNLVAATLVEELYSALDTFEQQGLAPYLPKWQQVDHFFDKPIKLHIGEQSIQGIAKGIDKNGALLLERDGTVEAFHGGEISVRAV